jgi:hypothetical protein
MPTRRQPQRTTAGQIHERRCGCTQNSGGERVGRRESDGEQRGGGGGGEGEGEWSRGGVQSEEGSRGGGRTTKHTAQAQTIKRPRASTERQAPAMSRHNVRKGARTRENCNLDRVSNSSGVTAGVTPAVEPASTRSASIPSAGPLALGQQNHKVNLSTNQEYVARSLGSWVLPFGFVLLHAGHDLVHQALLQVALDGVA